MYLEMVCPCKSFKSKPNDQTKVEQIKQKKGR